MRTNEDYAECTKISKPQSNGLLTNAAVTISQFAHRRTDSQEVAFDQLID